VERRISVVVTYRNCERTLARCLDSVAQQSYRHWQVIAVDDASTDASLDVLASYQQRLGDQLTVIASPERRFKLANFLAALDRCGPADIVAELDGDDELASPDALALIHASHVGRDAVWTQMITPEDSPWDVHRSTPLVPGWSRSHPPRRDTWTPFLMPG